MAEEKKSEERFQKALRLVAPGTPLREGLENILRAKTGALIVIGDSPQVLDLVSGGFKIDTEYTPSYLYELAKMDGAIILSHDGKRILYANAELVPDPSIPSNETGIRHRTAERVAKQTGELVIAISQRRSVVTLYKGQTKYTLMDVNVILAKANQAVQTLEKYKAVLEQSLTNLTAMEFEDVVTVIDVANVLQRTEMLIRIAGEISRYISELGVEGRLVSMQLEEILNNVESEGMLIIRDYLAGSPDKSYQAVYSQITSWTSEGLLDVALICRALGYSSGLASGDTPVTPRGYRILRKIPRLPMGVIENLVDAFSSLPRILNATLEELDNVEGIGEVRARAIKEGLKRLREQAFLARKG